MELYCKYDLSSISSEIINAQLQGVNFGQGAVQLEGNYLNIIGVNDFILTFYNHSKMKHIAYLVSPKGRESIAGDLFGFEFTLWDKGNYAQQGYGVKHLLNDLKNTVKGVYAFGTVEEREIVNEADIKFWYGRSGDLPDRILVSKNTMQLIGIEFITENWTYLISFGDRDYRICLDVLLRPNEFMNQYINNSLKLIDKIE